MPGLPDILAALSTGGAPVGNIGKDRLPLLGGLGAQQDYMQSASPAALAQVSPQGQTAAAAGMDPRMQALLMQILMNTVGASPGSPTSAAPAGVPLNIPSALGGQ